MLNFGGVCVGLLFYSKPFKSPFFEVGLPNSPKKYTKKTLRYIKPASRSLNIGVVEWFHFFQCVFLVCLVVGIRENTSHLCVNVCVCVQKPSPKFWFGLADDWTCIDIDALYPEADNCDFMGWFAWSNGTLFFLITTAKSLLRANISFSNGPQETSNGTGKTCCCMTACLEILHKSLNAKVSNLHSGERPKNHMESLSNHI